MTKRLFAVTVEDVLIVYAQDGHEAEQIAGDTVRGHEYDRWALGASASAILFSRAMLPNGMTHEDLPWGDIQVEDGHEMSIREILDPAPPVKDEADRRPLPGQLALGGPA